jgi:hypothetical protein
MTPESLSLGIKGEEDRSALPLQKNRKTGRVKDYVVFINLSRIRYQFLSYEDRLYIARAFLLQVHSFPGG